MKVLAVYSHLLLRSQVDMAIGSADSNSTVLLLEGRLNRYGRAPALDLL